jgi:hypothetical protein
MLADLRLTRAGHFLGRAVSRLLVFAHEGGTYVRDVGSWDPLGPLARAGYALDERAEASMLGQLARVAAAPART